MTVPTIVLVHGAWHGAWCWDHVAESLTQSGFTVNVVTLPGHDKPSSSKRLWARVGNYVSHLEAVIDSTDGEVVLVGHSMGGLTVQRVLENRQVAGAMLVASVPRHGVAKATLRLARRHPAKLAAATTSLSLWPMVANDDLVREHFFTDSTEDSLVERAGSKLQNESFLAFLSMIARLPRPSKVTTPVQVVAAAQDGIFTLAEQQDLANAYNSSLEVIDCGHDVMLESRWPELVEHIATFTRAVASSDTP